MHIEPMDANNLGIGGVVGTLMPPMNSIPKEFVNATNNNIYVRFQREWFYNGLKSSPKPKEGVDGKLAIRHLAAIQDSRDPIQEHKEAAVGYLASLWFEESSIIACFMQE